MSTTGQRRLLPRRGFIGAAIVIGVILLAAIIVIVASFSREQGNPAAGPTGSPPTSQSDSPSAGTRSLCGLPGFDTKNTLKGPPANRWKLVGTVAAPTEPSGSGPGKNDDGFRSCYAHTAEGALFAAVNFVALSSDSRNAPKMYLLIAEGPARPESSSRAQVAGFKVNSYSASDATIDVAWSVTSNRGALVSNPTVLEWQDGDWKIVITEAGAPIAPGPLESLGGYFPWAGV
jgi:hypothetical protein